MEKTRNHDRRPENTNISISIEKELLEKLDELAASGPWWTQIIFMGGNNFDRSVVMFFSHLLLLV